MKKTKLFIFIGIIATIFIAIYFGRSGDKQSYKAQNPEIKNYISSYSSGIISSKSTIKVRFVSDVMNDGIGELENNNLFNFSPTIDGKTRWIDKSTIEFVPNNRLPSGKFYKASLSLNEILDVPSTYSQFDFGFQVIKQNLDVSFDRISNYDIKSLNWQIVEGKIIAADNIEIDDIKKVLSADVDNKSYRINLSTSNNPLIYNFRIDSVERTNQESILIIQWDGKDVGFDNVGLLDIRIPALNSFKVLQTKVAHQPDQYVSVLFSDPLDAEQNLIGLVTIDKRRVKLSIDGNEMKVYPLKRLKGNHKLVLYRGIKNSIGDKTKIDEEIDILFNEIKPNVELVGKGVIIPNSKGINFPFKAVNLKAVNVKIVRIYEDNIAQFFQVNAFDESSEINRVGRTVYKNSVDLISDKAIDYGVWNTFALQLDKLIETEPGAIYRITLSFNKSQSLYQCQQTDSVDVEMKSTESDNDWDENNSEEYSSWDYFEDYDYSSYVYEDKDNPCKSSYYRYKKVSRNVLASNLGVIAKSGNDNKILIAVTNLISTDPVEGVEVKLLNFQQQEIGSGLTNSEGLLTIDVRKKAYILIAKKEGQFAYVRLDNNSSLSLSKFDVSGKVVQKGIKGFIYGERGVWRPGDSLFLNFILEDKTGMLPKNHFVKFELINPNGQIVKTFSTNKPMGNIYTFITKTDQDAITGNYSVRVRVGGAIFSKRLRIETFKPNRLKIKLDFGKEMISADDSKLSGELNAKWLHGAIASKLKADVKVTLSRSRTSFKRYSDYTFDDPTRKFKNEEHNIFDGLLDDKGNAKVAMKFDVNEQSPGMLKANFKVRVFEKGGDFSIDKFSIPFSPYDTYVGIKLPNGDKTRGMLLTDKKHKINIATLNAKGKGVDAEVKVEIYKIDWLWWWQKNADDNLSKYVGSSHYQPLSSTVVNTVDGKASSVLEIKYPDWGRYLIRLSDVNGGHSTAKIVYVDWPGWAGRATKDNPGGASMLTFSTDKQEYNVGEEVKLSFPSSQGGRALVSIENGSKVLKSFWVITNDKTTNFSFEVDKQMTPNVYVNITLIQPHNFTKNDLPIRLYGIVPISVIDPNTVLMPKLSLPNIIRPNQKVDIKVSEANGKAMTYTLAIVDEGILDVTRYRTPNPWAEFNAREALGVRSWDMYEYVMGAYAGELSGLLEIGGDGDLIQKGGKKANRFKPVVTFLGPFTLKAGAQNINSFIMPQYIGSVRTMVIAANNGAYGSAEETTPVKEDLMLLATLPRVVGPQEKVVMPITVFAMDKAIKDVEVKVRTNGLFKVVGAKTKKVHFSKTGDQIVNFDLVAANRTGIAKVEIHAKSGSTTAIYNIELDVRNANPYVVDAYNKVIDAGDSWKLNFDRTGIQGTNSAYVEVSSIPSINLENRLRYLIKYPHGCIEQTTSAAFPQLYLNDIMELSAETKITTKNNITQALNRLISFQTSAGGFAYWPGNSDPNDWGTSYAGHFIIEAKKKAYVLPVGMLDKWLYYQKRQANNWRQDLAKPSSDLMQAYRLYTLALANNAELGAMNRMKEKAKLSLRAKWRLAAAYALAGYKDIANQLLDDQNQEIRSSLQSDASFGSALRDNAMILETMLLLDKREDAAILVKKISKEMNSNKWLSTQTTAYSLIAVSKFIADNNTGNTISYSVSFNANNVVDISTSKAFSKLSLKNIKGVNKCNIVNKSDNVLFAKIISRGVPPMETVTEKSNNLRMAIEYRTLDGDLVDPSKLKQGSDFKVLVSIKNPGDFGDYTEMALTQIFPSGWEIHNSRMDEVANGHSVSIPDYMDIRDDRISYYFDIKKGESKTFVSVINASYLGKFYLPAVYCESMYDNSINASSNGKWVEVVE